MDTGGRELLFGSWTSWQKRRDLCTSTSSAGVYLLGYFSSPPRSVDAPDPERLPYEVIYVGDAKNLNSRPLTEPHHKVGPRFVELFGDAGLNFLYVAVGPLYTVDPEPVRYAYQRARSTYVENKLVWDYAQMHGHPPVLQVKNSALNIEWIGEVVSKLRQTK